MYLRFVEKYAVAINLRLSDGLEHRVKAILADLCTQEKHSMKLNFFNGQKTLLRITEMQKAFTFGEQISLSDTSPFCLDSFFSLSDKFKAFSKHLMNQR